MPRKNRQAAKKGKGSKASKGGKAAKGNKAPKDHATIDHAATNVSTRIILAQLPSGVSIDELRAFRRMLLLTKKNKSPSLHNIFVCLQRKKNLATFLNAVDNEGVSMLMHVFDLVFYQFAMNKDDIEKIIEMIFAQDNVKWFYKDTAGLYTFMRFIMQFNCLQAEQESFYLCGTQDSKQYETIFMRFIDLFIEAYGKSMLSLMRLTQPNFKLLIDYDAETGEIYYYFEFANGERSADYRLITSNDSGVEFTHPAELFANTQPNITNIRLSLPLQQILDYLRKENYTYELNVAICTNSKTAKLFIYLNINDEQAVTLQECVQSQGVITVEGNNIIVKFQNVSRIENDKIITDFQKVDKSDADVIVYNDASCYQLLEQQIKEFVVKDNELNQTVNFEVLLKQEKQHNLTLRL